MSDNLFTSFEDFSLYHGDCKEILPLLPQVDSIFADPPYYLSNDGLTVNSGKVVSVNKGDWDRIPNGEDIDEINYKWLFEARKILKGSGTIWISGTIHNIYSIVRVLKELNFKILNSITWQKTNPPPNFSCRCFTHSTEIIIWARKSERTPHYYNYDLMKALNGGVQMKDVWLLPSLKSWEKTCGKHPTQKPLSVLTRIVLASTKKGQTILDPFAGSSTTGFAANMFGRNYIGIDVDQEYLALSKNRKLEFSSQNSELYKEKLFDKLSLESIDRLDK